MIRKELALVLFFFSQVLKIEYAFKFVFLFGV